MSLFEAQAASIDRRMSYLLAYQYTGEPSTREPAAPTVLPRGVYPCADGFVHFIAIPAWWGRLTAMLGAHQWADDPRFADPAALQDPALKDEFDLVFYLWLAERGKQEVMEAAQAHHVPATAVNTPADLLRDPHLRARGYWQAIDHPAAGRLEYPGPPFRMTATPWRVRRPAPLLGQHTVEILVGELGYSRAEVARAVEGPEPGLRRPEI